MKYKVGDKVEVTTEDYWGNPIKKILKMHHNILTISEVIKVEYGYCYYMIEVPSDRVLWLSSYILGIAEPIETRFELLDLRKRSNE